MQKQKKGFLLFISSLIPGAGEMYMGFFKQGISIMTLFWAIIAIAGGLNISSLVIFLPVLWFYSFFHVHNLNCLLYTSPSPRDPKTSRMPSSA